MKTRLQVINVDCNFEYGEERARVEALGADLILSKARTEDELIKTCAEADIIMSEDSETLFTRRVIEQLGTCRGLFKFGVGVDKIGRAHV